MSEESDIYSSDQVRPQVTSKSENISDDISSESSDEAASHGIPNSESQLEQSDAEEEASRRTTDSFSDQASNDDQFDDTFSDFSVSESPKVKAESKKLILILQDIKKGLARLECEADEPVTAMFAIEHLFVSGYATNDSIMTCFEEVHREFTHLLRNIHISSIVFLMYEQMENLEIATIDRDDDWEARRLVCEVVDALKSVPVEVTGLRTMCVVIEKARLLKEFLEKEPGNEEMLHAIEKFLDNAAPLGMILTVLSGINALIKELKSDRLEYVKIQFPPYVNPVLAGYEPIRFHDDRPNDFVKEHIMRLVDELEGYGVDLRIDKSEMLRMKIVNLEIPNFHELLLELSECLKTVLEQIPGHNELDGLVIDLVQKPLIFYHLFLLEKRLVKLERSVEAEGLVPCLKKATHNLMILRKIHHFFRLLDGEMLVPYSTAVHLAYFRTFAHQLSGVDVLKHQPIILPLNVCTLIEISNNTITKINPAMIFQRIEFQKWIHLTMIDLFSEAIKATTDEDFNRASDWLVFLINVRAEYDVPEVIADEMKRLPPYPELSRCISSYITERSFEIEASSQIIHLELILQADLKDSSLDLKSANKRQFRQVAYMKQYRDILALTIADGTVQASKELDVEHEEDCFTNHSNDVQIVGLVDVILELSKHMPRLTRETLALHEALYALYAGSYCRDSVIELVRQSMINRSAIENADAFINAAAKLIRFSIFARVHDTLIMTTSSAYNPPFSITRGLNVLLLVRSISNRMLRLNSSGFFDSNLGREIGARVVQMLNLANRLNPFYPLGRDDYHRMKVDMDAIAAIVGNVDSFTGFHRAKRAVRYLVSLDPQYGEIEQKFDHLISLASDATIQSLTSEYFNLMDAIESLSSDSKDVQGCYEVIKETSQKAMMIMAIKHSIKLALSDETAKVCVFPFPADQFFAQDIVINRIHPEMVPRYDFPIPDRLLSLDHQIELVRLLVELQDENERLSGQLEELARCRNQHQVLKRVLDKLYEERRVMLADSERIKEETRHSREKLADSEDQERDQEELMKLKLNHLHDAAIDEQRYAGKRAMWRKVFDDLHVTLTDSLARNQSMGEEHIKLLREHERLVFTRIEREYQKAIAKAEEKPFEIPPGFDDPAKLPPEVEPLMRPWNILLARERDEIEKSFLERQRLRGEILAAKAASDKNAEHSDEFRAKLSRVREQIQRALTDCA